MIALLLVAALQAESAAYHPGGLDDEARRVGRVSAALDLCRTSHRYPFAPDASLGRINAFESRARGEGWSDARIEAAYQAAEEAERQHLGAQDTFAGMSWSVAWDHHVVYLHRVRQRCRELAGQLPGSISEEDLNRAEPDVATWLRNPRRSSLLGHPTLAQGLERLPDIPRNTLALPNTVDFWPGPGTDPHRWYLVAPLDKRPFLVVRQSGRQIAVRHALVEGRHDADAYYYVAMRQTSEALEEADSRSCPFGHIVKALRDMPQPEIIVPGTLPPQAPGEPQVHGRPTSITVFEARQADRQRAQMQITADHGAVVTWAQTLVEATDSCWRPMTPPAPLPSAVAN